MRQEAFPARTDTHCASLSRKRLACLPKRHMRNAQLFSGLPSALALIVCLSCLPCLRCAADDKSSTIGLDNLFPHPEMCGNPIKHQTLAHTHTHRTSVWRKMLIRLCLQLPLHDISRVVPSFYVQNSVPETTCGAGAVFSTFPPPPHWSVVLFKPSVHRKMEAERHRTACFLRFFCHLSTLRLFVSHATKNVDRAPPSPTNGASKLIAHRLIIMYIKTLDNLCI